MRRALLLFCVLGVLGVTGLFGVELLLRWRDPVGYRNLKVCRTLKPGITRDELYKVLGDPVSTVVVRERTLVYFKTASIAATRIHAEIQESTGRVLSLYRSETLLWKMDD